MKTLTRSIRRTLLTAAILGLTAASSEAATITWGTPQNITGDSDVSLDGSLIRAFNVGDTGVSAALVNTVNFESFAVGLAGATVGDFSVTGAPITSNTGFSAPVGIVPTLGAGYQTLLAAGMANGFGTVLTMSGLSVGTQYEFQWWCHWNSVAPALNTATTGLSSVSLQRRDVGTGVGQFALGTFTADSAVQTVAFSAVGVSAVLNGFQVRQVPEPSTWAMLAAGAASLLGFCRRRAPATFTLIKDITMKQHCLLAAALCAGTALTAHASVIQLTGGDPGEGYAPLGATFAAVDINGFAALAVQGVLFTGSNPNFTLTPGTVPVSSSFGANPFAPTTTNDANLLTIAQSAVVSSGGPIILTISGLSPGTLYQVDSIVASVGTNRVEQVSALGLTTVADSVGFDNTARIFDVSQALLPSAAGQIVMTYAVTSGGSPASLNGISVTRTVPEPSTWAMLAAGAASLPGLRRRR